MDLSRTAAAVLTLSGLALVVAGVCLVFVPAGLVIAGRRSARWACSGLMWIAVTGDEPVPEPRPVKSDDQPQ
jgi:hypothetical protein